MSKVRVAIIGVGSCASALMQGVHYSFAEVPPLGVPVHRGMTRDGLGQYLSQVIAKASGATTKMDFVLHETGTDVVLNYLPVGA